jgi:hypothetical protein
MDEPAGGSPSVDAAEGLRIIEAILEVARELARMRDVFEQADEPRREEIAALFDELSGVLRDIYGAVSEGETPFGKCLELQHYARQLPSVIGPEIGAEQAERLAKRLAEANEVEILTRALKAADRFEEIVKLAEAAGMFRTLAISTRAGR